MSAHCAYQYHLYKQELSSLDVDNVINANRREALVKHEIVASEIKRDFLLFKRLQGKLFCVYCQKGLKVYYGITGKVPSDMATIDHFDAICAGGLKYVESNFLCSCSACNNRRGNLPSYKVTETKYVF